MSSIVNFIVKTKNAKESEVRKALKEAGIDVISVATVYKEELNEKEKKED